MVVQSIPLITDLRTQNRNIGILYVATGQTTQGDNNGGMYMWNPSSTAADDSFYVIQVTGVATGRWLRIGAASNIYTANGSLINNRTVTLNGFTLSFAGSTYSSTYNADGTVTLGSLVGTGTRYVVAGPTGLLGATGTIPTPGTPTRFVETFTASAGQTIFNTANTLFTYFFDVYVNGVLLDNTSFTASANQVILTDPCSLNDIVQIIGFYNITYVGTLPPQAGNAGRFLTTDGTSLSWGVNPLGTVTSVDMSVPTGFAITGNPITSAGTLALGFAAGYSLPSNSVQANWTTAYNRSLTSAAVTGTSTKTLTLNEQDGSTIIATWSDYDTQGVTSVSVNVGNTGTDVNANVVNPTTTPTININVPSASATVRGALTSTDWTTFNSKQAAITLTTVGSSGAATFIANVLNIPDYGGALSGYVPTSRQLTINGTAYDLSADRSWSVGTVTSVNMSVPTGFAIANNPITTSGTLALSYAAGYALPTTASQGNWDTAYTFVSNFPSQTGNAGKYLTTDGSVLSWAVLNLANYVPTSRTLTINGVTYDLSADRTWTIVAGVSSVAGTAPISAVNVSGAVTISISQSSASTDGYLSSTDWTTFNSKQPAGNYITSLTGEATASGPGAASVTLTNSAVIGKVLTGLNVTGGSISATDSILAAFGKIQNQINGLIGGLQYQGTWNASTNTPTLTSGVGTNGYFYIVSVAGSTNLDGITDWKVGDWAVYHASTWQKVDNTESVTSVNGFTGAVSLTTSNISEGTNLYFTDLRARQAISLTTTGTSGAATYDNTTGVLNIPQYQGGVTSFNTRTGAITLLDTDVTGALGYTPVTNARTLTINGTTFDLTANRTWSVGTVTSVGLTMPSAFTVTNSPVTGSGTLTVTAAGLASQYVRGDGTLGDFPAGGGGGGASVSYYLNGSVNQGTFGGNTYYEMSKTPVIGLGTDFTISSNGYIASFITDANDPALLLIPGGNFNLEFYFSASSGGGAPSYYVELYKYDGTTFTLIASNSVNPDIITSGTATEAYFTSLSVPETVITATDRLAVRIYVTPAGRTITLHTEDNNLCQVITTFTTGLTALNGLTKQVQYFAVGTSGTDFAISSSVDTHTFNLPTASATNRGALSSADWTTFNNKVPATRTLTINSVSFDLSADRSWTIGPTIYSRGLQKFTATAGQTTFTITNGYTVGLVDVYRNGVKLDNALEFTASNGTTVVLTDAAALNDVIEVYKYGSEYIPNNALRTVNTFTATAAQTTFSVTYSVGLLDVFYNGAKLAAAEYTATNGTTVVLASACAVGDIVEIIAYSYLVNAYSGISGTGNSGYIPKFTSATSIGNSLIQDNGTTITLGGALSGTSATFSSLTNTYILKAGASGLISNSNLINDASGNLGLGVTPSAWWSGMKAVEAQGSSGGVFASASVNGHFLTNGYYDGTNWVYKNTGFVSYYSQTVGQHQWLTAPSGTAGNAISFTQAMTLNASGNLSVGNINDTYKLDVSGTGRFSGDLQVGSGGASSSRFQLRFNNWNTTNSYPYITLITPTGSLYSGIGINTSNDFVIGRTNGLNTDFTQQDLKISNSTGAATFSSSVTANGTMQLANDGDYGSTYKMLAFTGNTNGSHRIFAGTSDDMYFAAATSRGFAFRPNGGATTLVTITSGGNVGIGVSPSYRLDVSSGASGVVLNLEGTNAYNAETGILMSSGRAKISGFLESSGGTPGSILRFYTMPNGGSVTERMTITSGGNVGIGTTPGDTRLDVVAANGGTALNLRMRSADDYSFLQFVNNAGTQVISEIYSNRTANNTGSLIFSTNNGGTVTERMRITSGGEVYIAGTTDQGAYNLQCNGTGVWGAGAYVNGSDLRLKEDIKPILSGLDYVTKMNPVSFKYLESYSKDRTIQTGFIAQELKEIFDGEEWVEGIVKQGNEYFNVAYQNIIPILTKAIQELKAELDTLKNK